MAPVSFHMNAYVDAIQSIVKVVVTGGMSLSEAAKQISLYQHFWTVFNGKPPLVASPGHVLASLPGHSRDQQKEVERPEQVRRRMRYEKDNQVASLKHQVSGARNTHNNGDKSHSTQNGASNQKQHREETLRLSKSMQWTKQKLLQRAIVGQTPPHWCQCADIALALCDSRPSV